MRRNRLGVAVAAALASGLLLAAAGSGRLSLSSSKPGLRASATTTSNAQVSRASTPTLKPSTKGPAPPVNLAIEAPGNKQPLGLMFSNGSSVAGSTPGQPRGLMFSSGWPIVIRAAMPNALGIATDAMPSDFPTIADSADGYVILEDPDNCLELPAPFFRGPAPCSTDGSDETYVEFVNDVDQVGVADTAGDPARSTALADPAQSGKPEFNNTVVTFVGNTPQPATIELTGVGTDTGDSVHDGVGYGADDDLPGLVLLSPTGTGLVLDADFNPPYVRQQRNLAGFLNSVAYEMRDPYGATVLTASMVVPQALIAPLMQIDDCVGSVDTTRNICTGDPVYRIDGGPIQSMSNNNGSGYPYTWQGLYPIIFNSSIYELRAFMVNGTAPSVLADMNGDGQVTAADATLAGYRVISNEDVVRVRQYHGEICGGAGPGTPVYTDLDGNGRVLSYLSCPGGPGQLSKIPQ